jgi:Uncharacterized protein conserved in bacteria (DUF2255)
MRKAILGAIGVLALVAVGTYVAGEQREVVVLRTFDAAGAAHETKMWVVDHDGAFWVRVANRDRGWYRRAVANPHVELKRAGRKAAMTAHPDESPDARAAVDAAFRAKYGRVDAWYGFLLRRDPVPVRLVPDEGA